MHLMCRLNRHQWQTEYDDAKQPSEICSRCRHYRSDASWADVTKQVNLPPPPFSGGS
jgi:hypothetical protein